MEYLTVNETAQLLRVSPITIRRYIAAGRLEAMRVGRAIRVSRDAIERFAAPVNIATPNFGARAAADDDQDVLSDELLGNPFTSDDPLWNIMGIGCSDDASDVATNIHEYVADAILADKG
jgi:excisionase family DNA binding protein